MEGVSDDWLDCGHGTDASALAPVISHTPTNVGKAQAIGPGSRSSRLAGRVSLAIVAAVVVLGSAGAVFAIRESLFPSLGASTSRSVWQNPASPVEPALALTPTSTTTIPSSSTTTTTSITAPLEFTVTAPSNTIDQRRDASDPDTPGADDSKSGSSGSDDSGPGTTISGSGADGSGHGSDDSASHDLGAGVDPSGSGGSGSGSDGTQQDDSGHAVDITRSDDSGSHHSGSGSDG